MADFDVDGEPSGAELDMVQRKVTLLNYQAVVIFLKDCQEDDPGMSIAQALIRARISLLEARIAVEGATPQLAMRVRELRDQLDG